MNRKAAVIPFLIFIFTLLFLCQKAHAEKVLKDGVLQAYWKARWNDDVTINRPQLGFRYFPSEPAMKKIKVIDIFMDGSEEAQMRFIKSHFHHIPDNFLKYKEWYINQKGDLTVKAIRHYIECNTDNYVADFISFTPTLKPDAGTDDDTACTYGGSFPYFTSYVLKTHHKTGQLNSEPRENANVEYTFSHNDSVVKIKTINKEWMYVSLYDPNTKDRLSNKRGYIRFSDVTPLN